jgi:hypothetical protein
MEVRMGRTIVIAVVITVAGGLTMRSCARRMERRLAVAPPPAADTAAGPLDSARAIRLALQAYFTDHTARGEVARAARVTAFTADSAGFQIELGPRDGGPGTHAAVRVGPAGQVELRRLAR